MAQIVTVMCVMTNATLGVTPRCFLTGALSAGGGFGLGLYIVMVSEGVDEL